ncbi:hypothetical protein MUK42_21232 [Musa troglodytarum]|uniref:Uncharacterized protein n=1 Tax=Musa troglodytarum TaxID=320322 RepID=A0A9E7I2R4_9LILI|nr:hypothetical protein MUK42_21232 [Musa troglodytarum]
MGALPLLCGGSSAAAMGALPLLCGGGSAAAMVGRCSAVGARPLPYGGSAALLRWGRCRSSAGSILYLENFKERALQPRAWGIRMSIKNMDQKRLSPFSLHSET